MKARAFLSSAASVWPGEVGPMNEKQPVESLRAKFWDRLQHARPWECDALFEEIVSALPVERVKASRLKSMPRFRNRDELTNQKKLKAYCEDVRNGRTDGWKPLLVWGLRESGLLSVRDGSHRTWAIQNNGAQDLSVKVVFVKVGPLNAEIDGDSEVVGG